MAAHRPVAVTEAMARIGQKPTPGRAPKTATLRRGSSASSHPSRERKGSRKVEAANFRPSLLLYRDRKTLRPPLPATSPAHRQKRRGNRTALRFERTHGGRLALNLAEKRAFSRRCSHNCEVEKTCGCGASYDLSRWSLLPLLGRQADRNHRVANLEVRRCTNCGSTLATRTASERAMRAIRLDDGVHKP
jgi:hypothetical protein